MMPEVRFITVSADAHGQRLDNFLIRHLKGVPKSLVYRVIRKGEVRINKGRAKADRRLCENDIVRIPPVRMSQARETTQLSEALKKRLSASKLYDEHGLLIVNKPSGLAVHGGSGIDLGLIEALRELEKPVKFLELVHRLDRDTSGCVMVARKRQVLVALQDDLRARGKIEKTYLALVDGRWPNHRNSVDVPLQRTQYPNGERIVKVTPLGKQALTRFKVIERFEHHTLVQASPITGRTHQIRVHCLHAGHAIGGDTKYAEASINQILAKKGLKRLFLHAFSLTFCLPDQLPVTVEAPLPNELEHVLAALRS